MPGTFPTQPLFNTLIVATGAPSSSTGNNGDGYIDSNANMFYGPKANGTWPSGVSMVGPTGATGATGSTGAQGTAGTNGNTIISGTTTPPPSATGNNGDYYYNTSTYVLWGPKSSGAWPSSGTTLVGPQGATGSTGSTGATGSQGTAGTNGNTILNGTAAPPAAGTGNNGDFYLNTSTTTIYGPKASGAWPSTGTSLVGPQGASGSGAAAQPPAVLSSTAPTLSSSNSGTTYLLTGASQLSITLPASDANVYTYTFCHVSGAGGVKMVPGDTSGSIVTPGGASAGSAAGYVSEATIGSWFTLVRAASTSTWYMAQYFTPTNNAFTVGS